MWALGQSGPFWPDPEDYLLERRVRALGLHEGHWGVPAVLGWLKQLCPQLADPAPAHRQLPSSHQPCSPTPGPPAPPRLWPTGRGREASPSPRDLPVIKAAVTSPPWGPSGGESLRWKQNVSLFMLLIWILELAQRGNTSNISKMLKKNGSVFQ